MHKDYSNSLEAEKSTREDSNIEQSNQDNQVQGVVSLEATSFLEDAGDKQTDKEEDSFAFIDKDVWRKEDRDNLDINQDKRNIVLSNGDRGVIVRIKGDGNCLFRAVITGYKWQNLPALNFMHNHKSLRKAVVRELQKFKYQEVIKATIIAEKNIEKPTIKHIENYINDMSRDKEWGGEVEILAISNLLKRRIVIHKANNNYLVIPQGGEYDAWPVCLEMMHESFSREDAHVSFADHYNLVLPYNLSVLRPTENLSAITTAYGDKEVGEEQVSNILSTVNTREDEVSEYFYNKEDEALDYIDNLSSPNSLFTGREKELEAIKARLLASSLVSISSGPYKKKGARTASEVESEYEDMSYDIELQGERGIGKTQIAKAYAYKAKEEGAYQLIWWINSSDKVSFNIGYIELAKYLNLELEKKSVAQIIAEVHHVLKEGKTLSKKLGNWLIIYDDARPELLLGKVESEQDKGWLVEGLPKKRNNESSYGHVLITSPSHEWERILLLGQFSKQDALAYLGKLRAAPHQSSRDQLVLVRFLGYHPLAITQAARYITTSFCLLADYIQLFKQKIEEIREGNKHHIDDDRLVIRAAIELSLNSLISRGKDQYLPSLLALEILSFGSFLAPGFAPKALYIKYCQIKGYNHELLLERAIELLSRSGLITRQEEDNTAGLYLHEVVQYAVNTNLDKNIYIIKLQDILEITGQIYSEEPGDKLDYQLKKSLIRHISRVVESAEKFLASDEIQDIKAKAKVLSALCLVYMKAWNFCKEVSYLSEALTYARKAHELSIELYTTIAPLFSGRLEDVAKTLEQLNSFINSQQDMRENTFPYLSKDQLDLGGKKAILQSYNQLLNDYGIAEKDSINIEVAKSWHYTAKIFRQQGDYFASLSSYEKAVTRLKDLYINVCTPSILNKIMTLVPQEIIEILNEVSANKMWKEVNKSFYLLLLISPDDAAIHHNYACYLHIQAKEKESQGNQEEALELLNKVEDKFKEVLKLENIASSLVEYAQFLYLNNRKEEAKIQAKLALTVKDDKSSLIYSKVDIAIIPVLQTAIDKNLTLAPGQDYFIKVKPSILAYNLLIAIDKEGNVEEVREYLKEIVKEVRIDPSYVHYALLKDAYETLADNYLTQGSAKQEETLYNVSKIIQVWQEKIAVEKALSRIEAELKQALPSLDLP